MTDGEATARGWLVGVLELHGTPAFVRVNMQHPDGLPGHPYRIDVSVVIQTTRPDGMPEQVESDHLEELRRAFEDSLPPRAIPTIVVTLPRRRDFHYAAADTDWYEAWVATQRARNPSREMTFDLRHDPDWELYRPLLQDVRPAHDDLQAIVFLAKQGVDPKEPREISYFFNFPDETRASAAEAVLREHEYTTRVIPPETGSEWQLVATQIERLTPGIMAHMRPILRDFAREHGGVLDGWEAAISPARATRAGSPS